MMSTLFKSFLFGIVVRYSGNLFLNRGIAGFFLPTGHIDYKAVKELVDIVWTGGWLQDAPGKNRLPCLSPRGPESYCQTNCDG